MIIKGASYIEKQAMDGSLKDLIKNRKLFVNLLVFTGLWIVTGFNWYLVYFQLSSMSGDFFINVMITASSDILAYSISGFLIDALGIRICYLSSFAIAITGGVLYLVFRVSNPSLIPIFLLLSNYGNSWGCNINWNSNAKLFPVLYASSTNGVCYLISKLSTIVAP